MKSNIRAPGQRALRRARCSEPGRTYHVTTTTWMRRPVFSSLPCARALIRELRFSDHSDLTCTLAFVVMPDHFHWLFELGGLPLGETVKRVKGRSSRVIGQLENQGRLWQPGYFDHALRKEEDLREVSRYIVANPLRAGLVRDIREYPHWDAVWLTAGLQSL